MELGSIADWVGAIGTAGALFVTIGIVLGDRRRSRRVQAEAVTVWSSQRESWAGSSSKRYLEVSVFNGSSAPLVHVYVFSHLPGGERIEEHLAYDAHGVAPVEAGATRSASIRVEHYVNESMVFLFFTERGGQRWARRLKDGELMPAVRARHLAIGASNLRASIARSYPAERA